MTSARTRIFGAAIAVVAPLGLVACGGGDDNGGGGTSVQDQVAELFIGAVAEALEGEELSFELDEDCVKALTDQLSDADAQAIVDAGLEGEPETSAEADAIGEQLESCISVDEGG